MPIYHLRRTMQFACDRGGRIFDAEPITAIDLPAAIRAALGRTATPANLVLTSLMLCAASGAVLWSRAYAQERAGLSPAMC